MHYAKITVTEGTIKLHVPNPKKYPLDSKMPVFYNPVQQLNRDISVVLLTSLPKSPAKALDLLAATGARGLRIAQALPETEIWLNDGNPDAAELIKENAELNDLKDIVVTKENANKLLERYQKSFDYVDVDPFGTPNPFLENAIKALKPYGILAVTATDTSALCGTYPSACMRKYNSKNQRHPYMHESGLRILIKHIQTVAADQGVALEPIFSHSSNHYMRTYLKYVRKDPKEILKQHKYIQFNLETLESKIASKGDIGPLWTGDLWDSKLIAKMAETELTISPATEKLLETIVREAKIKEPWHFDIHKIAKQYKLPQLPKVSKVIEKLRKKGYKAERTHFSNVSIKTNAKIKNIIAQLR